MSKPPSTHSTSRPGSIRGLDLFASTKSLKSLKLETSHENLPYDWTRPHCYDKREVPYPLSYEKQSLELYSLDRALMYRVKDGCSFVDFKGNTPKRCLDLGTGLGDWCIDAAMAWPDCTFVGYDVADIQINLRYVEPSISSRIRWMHGNFLEPLPFASNEFDYVHLFGAAFCVPEDKWHLFFDEINRVMKPGGHVEIMEEDAIFPVLPRWFTAPLHSHSRRSFPRSKTNVSLPLSSSEELPHDYALLETLFHAAFESRFVNPTPSSIIPGYFSATFTHVVSPPILLFPMPPLAPLPPFPELPRTQTPTRPNIPQKIMEDTRGEYSLPPIVPTIPLDEQMGGLAHETPSRPHPRSSSSHRQNRDTVELERIDTAPARNSGRRSRSSPSRDRAANRSLGSVAMPAFAEQGETTEMGGQAAYELFAMDVIAQLDQHASYTHLKRMFGLVYSAKETMWEELLAMVAQGNGCLDKYGWEDEDYTAEASRENFDLLWEQYTNDMHARIALWHPMTQYGWSYPRRDPMTKAELLDEDRLRQAILEARRCAKEEEIQPTMRAIRLLVGVKDC